jgi:hypothetical protein
VDDQYSEIARTTVSIAARLVGLDESVARSMAEQRGCEFHVVKRDGVVVAGTIRDRTGARTRRLESLQVIALRWWSSAPRW